MNNLKKFLVTLSVVTILFLTSNPIVTNAATVPPQTDYFTNDATEISETPPETVYSASVLSPSKHFSHLYRFRVKVSSYLNVRSGPGTDYSIIGCLYSADTIICDGTNLTGQWYHMANVSSMQSEGWVSKDYLVYVGLYK